MHCKSRDDDDEDDDDGGGGGGDTGRRRWSGWGRIHTADDARTPTAPDGRVVRAC